MSSIFYCIFCIKLQNVHAALAMLKLVVLFAVGVANTKAVLFFRFFFPQLMQCVKLAELAPNVSLA